MQLILEAAVLIVPLGDSHHAYQLALEKSPEITWSSHSCLHVIKVQPGLTDQCTWSQTDRRQHPWGCGALGSALPHSFQSTHCTETAQQGCLKGWKQEGGHLMSGGLTALFSPLPAFLLMVLVQKPYQKLPCLRYFPGTHGPSYVSLLSVLKKLCNSPIIVIMLWLTLSVCPPLSLPIGLGCLRIWTQLQLQSTLVGWGCFVDASVFDWWMPNQSFSYIVWANIWPFLVVKKKKTTQDCWLKLPFFRLSHKRWFRTGMSGSYPFIK